MWVRATGFRVVRVGVTQVLRDINPVGVCMCLPACKVVLVFQFLPCRVPYIAVFGGLSKLAESAHHTQL